MPAVPCFAPLRAAVVNKMCDTIKEHAGVMYLILFAKLLLPRCREATLAAALCACVNIVWATERIWRVQTKNFFIWDELTQRLFLALRSVSRALEVIMLGLWLAVFFTILQPVRT